VRNDVTLANPEPTDRNLPATATDARLTVRDADRRPVAGWRQPVSVAYLPLALVTFIVLAFAMAMWTFLAATT
jgi:hypothetical protein